MNHTDIIWIILICLQFIVLGWQLYEYSPLYNYVQRRRAERIALLEVEREMKRRRDTSQRNQTRSKRGEPRQ